MITATCKLKSVSPYSQSRPIQSIRPTSEPCDDFEQRTWRERIHADDNGIVFIPGQAFKGALADAAMFLGKRVPGRGTSTFSKHFLAGILVLDNPSIGVHIDSVKAERLYLNADGKRGGSKRVWRHMPVVPSWEATVQFYIADPTISLDVFTEHLKAAGMFIGIGRFRPRNGGTKGRFTVESIDWQASAVA